MQRPTLVGDVDVMSGGPLSSRVYNLIGRVGMKINNCYTDWSRKDDVFAGSTPSKKDWHWMQMGCLRNWHE